MAGCLAIKEAMTVAKEEERKATLALQLERTNRTEYIDGEVRAKFESVNAELKIKLEAALKEEALSRNRRNEALSQAIYLRADRYPRQHPARVHQLPSDVKQVADALIFSTGSQ